MCGKGALPLLSVIAATLCGERLARLAKIAYFFEFVNLFFV